MNATPAGLLLIDKPVGPTSHDLVYRARRATGQRRIGHTGTLDPLASGLLILVLGQATRLARFVPGSPKTYTGLLELGWSSVSDDVTGECCARHDGPLPPAGAVLEAAATFVGPQMQLPPKISARKVGGQRLYKLTRKGIEVPIVPSPVEIDRFSLDETPDAARFRFQCVVSTGTYVRSLVRDLGEKLGCGAVLAELRRTRIASMTIDEALRVGPDGSLPTEDLDSRIVPIDRMPLDAADLKLASTDESHRFVHGLRVATDPAGSSTETVRVIDPAGRTLGMGEREGGELRPKVVLVEPPA